MADKDYTKNTKRLAKNAIMLYVRQVVIILINFFMTRELLTALGVVDFGLANVIGGVVTMFSFLSGMLSSASSRYFNFDLGKNDFVGLKKTFNTSIQIYFCLIVLIVILSETVGLWAFKTKLDIPADRAYASLVFFQFSVLAFIFNIATLPFLSLVISHENMKVFSWLSIFEALGKLAIIYLLFFDYFDRLSVYGVLLFVISLMHFFFYFGICFAIYPESKIFRYFDGQKFKELLLFSGWNVWGATAMLFSNIFVNILLNNFFGAALNSARAIATQVSGALTTFSNNFLTAVRPQIVKYWASDDKTQSYNLVYQSAKFGYLFVLFLSIPILLEPTFVLKIWLGEVPDYAAIFLVFAIIQVLVSIISHPMMTLAQATGRIALYQTVVGLIYWLTFPLVYIVFKMGGSPIMAMVIAVFIEFIALIMRLILTRRCSKIPLSDFLIKSILPCLKVSIFAPIVPYIIAYLLSEMSFLGFVLICACSVISTFFCSYIFALTKENKEYIKQKFDSNFRRFKIY